MVDASLFQAYSNPRKKDESGKPSDSDATWAKETSTGQWVYGYELHIVSCADSELPIALTVTTGKRNGGPLFPQLLRKASDFHISMRIVGADGNYHSAENHLEAHRLGACTVIPLPDRRHGKPGFLAQRLRVPPGPQRRPLARARRERRHGDHEECEGRLPSAFHG